MRSEVLTLFEDAAIGARLLRDLPSFLRHPLSLEHARAALGRRRQRREADFLALMDQAIYRYAASPYRGLLRLAGCEYGDLERLVERDGVEEALRALYRAGVYLTVDELKGRRPAIRGSASVAVDPVRLRNPAHSFGVLGGTSGSRGRGTLVPIDLAFLRDRAVNTRMFLEARGAAGWHHAIWEAPGSAMVTLLRYARCGLRPVHWFSPVDPATPGLHPRYRWSARMIRFWSALSGAPLPGPTPVSLDDPLSIVEWLANVLLNGGIPHLDTFVSPAVRLCLAADDAGIDIRGAQFTVTGEPFTATRMNVIRRAGAEVVPSYRSAEAGAIGFGCLAPEIPDEVHQYDDLVAVIQPSSDAETNELPRDAVLVTSLRPTAPVILLNVSMGDRAVVNRRVCGCPLERLGWATHLHTIRSFEKLTAGGMTFLDAGVVGVLEEVLPARFGGAATDYQLVEDEGVDGQPRLRLLVHPSIGPLETATVAEAFLEAIGGGGGAERVMALQWRQAGLPRVERAVPRATASGKILHLHTDQPVRRML